MFELQSYNYYEGFSQCFEFLDFLCVLARNQMSIFICFLISYDVILEYVCVLKKVGKICHDVLKIANMFKKLYLIFMIFLIFTKNCDSM
jgi:hypothetical protein